MFFLTQAMALVIENLFQALVVYSLNEHNINHRWLSLFFCIGQYQTFLGPALDHQLSLKCLVSSTYSCMLIYGEVVDFKGRIDELSIAVSFSEASSQGKLSSTFLSNTWAAADSRVVAWTVHVQSRGSGFRSESAMLIFNKKDLRDCSNW